MSLIDDIVRYKKAALARQKRALPPDKLLKKLRRPFSAPRFKKAISKKGIHLIAELKKVSPSAGLIRRDFDCAALAQHYREAGAGALSVLTEEKFFKGDISFLDEARRSGLPILRKDFIIDDYQIYESKLHGADAILLIASLLTREELGRFLALARALRLDVLTEVHDSSEIGKALAAGADIIGINARDLRDFSVNLRVFPLLIKKIPQDKLIVCESGIRTPEDLSFIKRLPCPSLPGRQAGGRRARVNAVLVGEALMRAKDVFAKTKAFVDILRRP